MPPIYILTEGKKQTGFGHLTRCVSLYQAFSKKNAIVQLIVNGDSTSLHLLSGTNNKLIDWITNIDEVLNLLERDAILIIDSLLADFEMIRHISKHTKLAAVIDDYNRRNYQPAIVIDWTIFCEDLYVNQDKKYYLAGASYTALRKSFWEVETKKINPVVNTVLIIMGGGDVRHLSLPILTTITNQFPFLRVKIIVTDAYKDYIAIKEKAETNKHIQVLHQLGEEEMVKVFIGSDIVITAGGQTIYELARTGTPCVVVQVADNQKYDIEGWRKTDFIEFAGNWDDEGIIESIKLKLIKLTGDFDLRKKKQENGQLFIDGKGGERIADELLKRYHDA